MFVPPRDAPYYFMSYAHTPPPTKRRGGANPNEHIAQFHEDLSSLIMERTALPPGAAPGFFDDTMDTGVQWRKELLYELGRCRVLLPMLSPRYFENEWTRKEWFAFTQREARDHNGELTRQTGILPVNWADYNEAVVPRPIGDSQAFRPVVLANKSDLLTLIVERDTENYYWKAVNHIARTIIRTAESTVLGPLPFTEPSELDDAFKRSELGGSSEGEGR